MARGRAVDFESIKPNKFAERSGLPGQTGRPSKVLDCLVNLYLHRR